MKRKIITGITIIIVLFSIQLNGCTFLKENTLSSRNKKTSELYFDISDKPLTIKIAINSGDGRPSGEIGDIIDEFVEKYPNISVEYVDTSTLTALEYRRRYEFFEDNEFDILLNTYHTRPLFASYAACLREYLNNDTVFINEIYPEFLQYIDTNNVYENIVDMLPLSLNETPRMYCNRGLFNELDIPYPDNNWTIHEFINILNMIKEQDTGNKYIPMIIVSLRPFFEYYVSAFDVNLYKKQGSKLTSNLIENEELTHILEMLLDYVNNGTIVFENISEFDELTKENKAVISPHPVYHDQNLQHHVEIIKTENRQATWNLNGMGFSIHKDSNNKEAAWELIKFIVRNNNSSSYVIRHMDPVEWVRSYPIIRRGEAQLPAQDQLALREYKDKLPYYKPMDVYDHIILDILSSAVRKVINGEQSLVAALLDTDEYVNRYIFDNHSN